MNAHIGDDAALYALGALDDAERAAVDAHVAGCAACAGLLGEAERDATRLFACEPQHHVAPPARVRVQSTWTRWRATVSAVAAILIVGFLPSLYLWQQNRSMNAAMNAQAAAMHRLASASFRSADFSGRRARVMYARDGSWYVVIVRDARRALRVVWMHDGNAIDLGAAVPHGNVAMLYLPHSHVMHRLALMEGGRVVAEAQLAYESKSQP